MSWLGLLGALVLSVVVALLHLTWYLRWERAQTAGMAYYGRPLADRRALKRRIRLYSLPARVTVRLVSLLSRPSAMPAFEFEGVAGPPGISSPEVFARAKQYKPRPEDVFVVTQMRCGTTWMQQVVYEVVMGGRGDLSDAGHGHLYAVSPWIDAINSVAIDDAPLVGERPTRIIKSHLPTALCPYSPGAKYIYVTRHPVSCFASIVDYNRTLLGPLMLGVTPLVHWFCSKHMYWLPWPEHVSGWWAWSVTHPNVLFVHFETMKTDLAAVVDQVAHFLDVRLTAEERDRVVAKCTFEYMQEHEDVFEMSPPTMFSVVAGRFMASGKASRDADVTPAVREWIRDYCRASLADSAYPVRQFYPDLVRAREADGGTPAHDRRS